MNKKRLIVIIVFLFAILLIPIKTYAFDYSSFISKNVFILDKCSDALLGCVNEEDSVAWLLQKILNYVKIIGPIIVIVLSTIDFVKVVVTGDDKEMGKAQNKLFMRLILCLLLFFIPTLVSFLLNMFGITADPTAGLH